MWMNYLSIYDLHINNFYEKFKDGLALLKIIDKMKPRSDDWKKQKKQQVINLMKKVKQNYTWIYAS